MTAEIYCLGFDRCLHGEATVVFRHRADGVIEVVADYWKPTCDFGGQPRPNPPFGSRGKSTESPAWPDFTA